MEIYLYLISIFRGWKKWKKIIIWRENMKSVFINFFGENRNFKFHVWTIFNKWNEWATRLRRWVPAQKYKVTYVYLVLLMWNSPTEPRCPFVSPFENWKYVKLIFSEIMQVSLLQVSRLTTGETYLVKLVSLSVKLVSLTWN